MCVNSKLPEIFVFAGPNGSGKSTVTDLAKITVVYINADNIKAANNCTDPEAAQKAESLRNMMIEERKNFTFETVLSTDRNLILLKKAKEQGYFIRCVYVLTSDPVINVDRIKLRVEEGGHDVPDTLLQSFETNSTAYFCL